MADVLAIAGAATAADPASTAAAAAAVIKILFIVGSFPCLVPWSSGYLGES
jgi:hypothetical protein